MMRILFFIKKTIFLEPIRPYLSVVDRAIRLPMSFIINILKAASDVMGPYTFAIAVGAISEKEDKVNFLGLPLSPAELLYLAAFLYAYSRTTPFLVRITMAQSRRNMMAKLIKNILLKPHKLPYKDIQNNRNLLEQSLQYAREVPELITFVPSDIHQPLFSFISGSVVVFLNYGSKIGSIFSIYVFLKTMMSMLNYELLGAKKQVALTNKAFLELVGRFKEVLSNYDLVITLDRKALEEQIANLLASDYVKPYASNVKREAWAYLLGSISPFFADMAVISYVMYDKNISFKVAELVFLLNFLSIINSNSTRFIEACYRAFRLMMNYEEIEKIFSLIDENPPLEEENAEGNTDHDWVGNVLNNGASVQFENVCFRYDINQKYILKNLSFFISAKSSCAIVGSSGSGKSTIAKLLLRLYKPESGTISINGRDINEISSKNLYKILGYLPQEVPLFSKDPVHFNIAYGVTERNEEVMEMKKSLESEMSESSYRPSMNYGTFKNEILKTNSIQNPEQCSLLNNFPSKLSLECEEAGKKAEVYDDSSQTTMQKKKGGELSVGQKQRVGIARLLIRQSSLFIFDEPTSSLDSETEAKVLTSVKEVLPSRTSIMIAHRLNTIVDADKIIVIEDGKVCQEGTHNDLLNVDGKYSKLWSMQMKI